MANNDGFSSSSQIMYPAVTTSGDSQQQLMPAMPYAAPAMPAMGAAPQRGPELLHGGFNQTWLINCLRRRWLMAFFLGSLFAAATAGLLLWLFPLSSSITALVEIKKDDEDAVLEQKRPFSPHELEVFQETQLSLIKSQFVLQSALGRPEISQLEAVRKEEPDPVTWLQDNLNVSFYGQNLQLRYDGEEDSEEMKKIVNAVIDSYRKDVLGKRQIRSQETVESLEEMHKDLSSELRKKLDDYNTLAEEIGGVESQTANTILSMLATEVRDLNRQISEKRGELVDMSINKEVIKQSITSPTAIESAVAAAVDEDPMMANYKAEEYEYIQQLRALKAASKTGTSAAIKRLESGIAQLQRDAANYRASLEQEARKQIKSQPSGVLNATMTEYVLRKRSVESDLAELNAKLEEKIAEIEEKGVRDGQLSMLASEIEQLTEIESQMDYDLRRKKIANSASGNLFRVLQPATAIDRINKIQRYALAGLGGIATFCAACYGIALLEFRRRRLNRAEDIDEGLGLRVLGVLPSVASRKAMSPGSMIAAQVSESIDNVRATLMHDSTTSKRQVVLVTSPATMEGTTTVASHLALSLVRAGRRTLLIDGDIREPALHKLFGLPLEDGLSEVLRSDIDVADAVRPTNTEGLWLLTAGHCDMDSIHALATDQPQPIFEKLREEFDFIIIDGAPVLGLSDSISVGQHVDGAILTVLRDHSEVRKVYQAIELLRGMGIRLLGSVVNGVPLKADRRIAQLHKNQAKKPKKLAAATTTSSKPASKPATKKEEPVVQQDEEPEIDFGQDISDDLGAIELGDEVELDFDDLDLDDK